MEKRQTFDFWSLRRPKELSDCGRSSPAFESLGRQFEPARAERTSSSGLAEAGESQNCLSRKRGRKTIKRGLRVSRPLVLEKNGGEFLFHSHFFALSLAPVVSLSPGSHLVRARSLFLSFLPSLVRTQHPHLRAAACFRKAISKVVPEEGASRQTIALASAFERSSNRSQGVLLSLSLTPFPSPPPSLSARPLSPQTNTNSMLSALIAAMATAARSSVSSSGTRMATTTTTKLVARRFSAALSPAPRPSLPGCSSARSMPSALRAYAADAALVSKNNGKKEERPLFETANLAI